MAREFKGIHMRYLYGSKKGGPLKLVATFDREQQLLAYVRWATLESTQPQHGKFEQGSALAGYDAWEQSPERLTGDDPEFVLHGPTPNMM
jgi:hypothetical protein